MENSTRFQDLTIIHCYLDSLPCSAEKNTQLNLIKRTSGPDGFTDKYYQIYKVISRFYINSPRNKILPGKKNYRLITFMKTDAKKSEKNILANQVHKYIK